MRYKIIMRLPWLDTDLNPVELDMAEEHNLSYYEALYRCLIYGETYPTKEFRVVEEA